MNILIIPTTDWLCHPTPHRHHYLARELARNHNVYVMYFDMYKSNTKVSKYGEVLIRAGGVAKDDLASYYIKNRTIHKKNIEKAIKEYDVDVVIGANLLASLSGFQCVRKLRKEGRKVVGIYDVSDYFPESASIYYPDNPLKGKIIHWGSNYLFKENLKLADGITSVSQPLKDLVDKAQPNKDSQLVTNGVETRRFLKEYDSDSLKNKLDIDGRVIGMVGSLEKWLEIEPTLHGFKKLLKKYPDLTYLLVGGSIKTTYDKELKELVKKLDISDKVIFTGFIPYEDVPLYIKAMDIAICPFRSGLYMSDIALPNKIFEYLACGKRIASTHLKEVKREAGQFITFYEGEQEFADKVGDILDNEQTDINERITWVSKYSWDNKAKELEALFAKHLDEV